MSGEPWGLTGGMERVGVIGIDMVVVSSLIRDNAIPEGERARHGL